MRKNSLPIILCFTPLCFQLLINIYKCDFKAEANKLFNVNVQLIWQILNQFSILLGFIARLLL